MLVSTTVLADPRYDYLLHCAGCHLENGAGAPPEVPDMRADMARFLESEAGRAYFVRVPGSAQVPIDDQALAELLNWMIPAFRPDLTGFQAFDAETIAPLRRKPLKDPLRFRNLLLNDQPVRPDADL